MKRMYVSLYRHPQHYEDNIGAVKWALALLTAIFAHILGVF